jgi:citrate/tricarballylate utilization protein
MTATAPHATTALAEADRLMTVCNSCRYCEGLCAVFPAMELRRSFADADLDYLANLCHSCGACFVDCQFSPPHEFNVNVPRVLAEVRTDSYETYAWPRALAPLFQRHGVVVAIGSVAAFVAFVAGFVVFNAPGAFFATPKGPGAFYALMPHNTMALLFGLAFGYAILAITFSASNFWRAIGPAPAGAQPALSIWQATKDASRLRYLDGGGPGCAVAVDSAGDSQPDRRKLYHHMTFYGFLLCFAATSTGTLYHYLLSRVAPYPWYDLPVILGSLGGLGLLIGPLGLWKQKSNRDPALRSDKRASMDQAFLLMLFLTSLTGFAVLLLRTTPLLGLTLALHLGVVLVLFLTLPYGKFVHGIYRFLALVRAAQERHAPLK